MTFSDHSQRLQATMDAIRSTGTERAIVPAAMDLLATIKARVRDGKGSLDNKIGTYSTKPISVTKDKLVVKSAFVGTSKSGKTMRLPQGYKELRQKQGLKSDGVNVEYSGAMLRSYGVVQAGPKVFLAIRDSREVKKRRALEGKYGPILTASQSEFLAYRERVNKGFAGLTLQSLSGYHV